MKKLALLLVLAMVLGLFAGCGGNGGAAEAPVEAAAETAAPVAVEDFEPVVLKFSYSSQESSADTNSNTLAVMYFADEIAKRTEGNVTVEIYWGGALASSNEDIVNGLQSGGFDFNLNGHGTYGDYTDAFFPFSIPYLFLGDEDYAAYVSDEEAMAVIAKDFEEDTGIKLLTVYDCGFRQMTSNKSLIKTPEDMKGLKLRTMSDPYQIAAMETLGAAVTPVAWGDLFTALQQGLVDAQENPTVLINSAKLYEVQKYMTLTRHNVSAAPLTMNKAAFDALPAEYQQVIMDVAKESQEYQRVKLAEIDELLMNILVENGMEIYDPTPEELAKFQEVVMSSWDAIEEAAGSDRFNAVVDKVTAIQQELGMK